MDDGIVPSWAKAPATVRPGIGGGGVSGGGLGDDLLSSALATPGVQAVLVATFTAVAISATKPALFMHVADLEGPSISIPAVLGASVAAGAITYAASTWMNGDSSSQ